MKKALLLMLTLLCANFVLAQDDDIIAQKPIFYEHKNSSYRSYFVEQYIASKLSKLYSYTKDTITLPTVRYTADEKGNITAKLSPIDENNKIHKAISDIITNLPRFKPAISVTGKKTEFSDSLKFRMRFNKKINKFFFESKSLTPPVLKNNDFHTQPQNNPDSTLSDQFPTYKDGDLSAFRNFVSQNVKYPQYEAASRISGRVIVLFTVNQDGYIDRDITVVSTPTIALSDEVIRVIRKSERWTPGVREGKYVRVSFTLPIEFKIPTAPNTLSTRPARRF